MATGAVAFMKDLRANNAFFLRLVNLQTGRVQWEQELFRDFQYTAQRPFFHCFFTDTCAAGFSFPDENEALAFYQKVSARETLRVQSKPLSKKSPISIAQSGGGQATSGAPLSTSAGISGGKKKKGKLDKSAIGAPTDFRHVNHVGFDSKSGGFSTENMPAEWNKVINQAGVTKEQLTDQDTAKFIYEFMKSYDPSAKKSAPIPPPSNNSAPALPSSPRPAISQPSNFVHLQPANAGRRAPPPPPNRHPAPAIIENQAPATAPRQAPPSVPSRAPPPPSRIPPPPSRDPEPSPYEERQQVYASSAPAAPPLPPPMPVRQTEYEPPAPSVKKSAAGSPRPGPPVDFLASIRQAGASSLKPAAEREIPASSSQDDLANAGGGDVANALKMALASRQNAMSRDDDSSDEEDGADDDW